MLQWQNLLSSYSSNWKESCKFKESAYWGQTLCIFPYVQGYCPTVMKIFSCCCESKNKTDFACRISKLFWCMRSARVLNSNIHVNLIKSITWSIFLKHCFQKLFKLLFPPSLSPLPLIFCWLLDLLNWSLQFSCQDFGNGLPLSPSWECVT